MKNLKQFIAIAALLSVIVTLIMCNNKTKSGETSSTAKQDSVITPVNLKIVVPGFKFPEDSTTILSWVNNPQPKKIYDHAWGVWAGLTAQSGESYQGDSLLVYQTWTGINELVDLTQNQNGVQLLKANKAKSRRTLLAVPEQFKRKEIKNPTRMRMLKQNAALTGTIDTSATFFVGVSYSPSSAAFTLKNSLLKQSVQNSYLKTGAIGAIPAFPNDAVNIKPVYYIGKQTDSLIRIPAWHGEPTTPQAYDPSVWNTYVYVDVHNHQPKNKHIVPSKGLNPTKAQMDAATCNVSDFIYYRIDAATAAYLNQQQGAGSFAAGDVALLVAMHVTTKEISNWTWQTFYWAPDADDPKLPSNPIAVSQRPKELSHAAAHYALSTAYSMVLPNQPVKGGKPGDIAVIGYNPYLEAGFDPSTFAGYPNTWRPKFVYGMQTNCMSCHALASPQNLYQGQDTYNTDQYVDMGGSKWINKVQLDFAWSLRDNSIPDTAAGAKKK